MGRRMGLNGLYLGVGTFPVWVGILTVAWPKACLSL